MNESEYVRPSSSTIVFVACLFPAFAYAESLTLTGFYKNLLSVTTVEDNFGNLGLTDGDVAVDDFQRLRIKFDYVPTDSLELRLHYETRHAWGETERIGNRLEKRSMLVLPVSIPGRTRFLDLESEIESGSNWVWSHDLDRFQIRWMTERLELTVGRQPVSWGTGLLWNPTDLFAGFSPTEIDRDEKLGVDVVRMTYSPNLDISLDLVAEPLDKRGPYRFQGDDSSLALRAGAHVGEYDLSAVGGQVAGDVVMGADFSGYVRDAGFRGEFLYTNVKECHQRNYTRMLLSVDYGFAVRWNPYLAVEYYYNGLGTDDPDRYLPRLAASSVQRAFQRGNSFNLGRQYIGTVFRLTPSALVNFQSITLFNLDDTSVQEFISVSRSLTDNIDFLLGANVGFGGVGTEFGGFSEEQAGIEFKNTDLVFAFLKMYF